MDTMRRAILLSSVRRVQERAFVQSTVEQRQQDEGCTGEDGYASSSASGLQTLSPSGHWKLALRTAAKNARSGKHGAELSASTDNSCQVEDPWQQVSSLTPFLALQKLLATIRNNCDSIADNESGNSRTLGAGDTLLAAFGRSQSGDGFAGDRRGQGDWSGGAGGAVAPSIDFSDSRVAQGRTVNDRCVRSGTCRLPTRLRRALPIHVHNWALFSVTQKRIRSLPTALASVNVSFGV